MLPRAKWGRSERGSERAEGETPRGKLERELEERKENEKDNGSSFYPSEALNKRKRLKEKERQEPRFLSPPWRRPHRRHVGFGHASVIHPGVG